jgi:outer membrane protein TolC
LALSVVGCARDRELSTRHELAQVTRARSQSLGRNLDEPASSSARPAKSDLNGYTALALAQHPEIEAAFARWQASVWSISKARRLPDPTLTFGAFVRAVETRVGPQRARIGLQQTFPWPTKIRAGADAASSQAKAMHHDFEAQALMVAQRVARAYWNLWELRQTRGIYREDVELLRSLAQTVRARLATGFVDLADVQQLDLRTARLEDKIRTLDENEHALEATLIAAIGSREAFALPTPDAPPAPQMPSTDEETLAKAVQEHPMIAGREALANAADFSVKSQHADRLPSFSVGADWIVTGDARMPDVKDSGKDAVMIGAGVRIPLWQGSYAESEVSARAMARAQRADERAVLERAVSEFKTTLSQVRDAIRRVKLYEETLIPLAKSTCDALIGAYTVGRGTIAELIAAQRDLLELRIEHEKARADYARAWAKLEELTGQELQGATEKG